MNQNVNLKQWKFKRYLLFVKYSSFKKIINLMLAINSWLVNKVMITTKPAFLRVEISRKCSVNCLYCYEKKEDVFYPIELYKDLIDKLKDYLFVVSLYEIGEPLENENIIEYIKYAKGNKIGTIISTNLSIEKKDEFWESLVMSGLDKIIVAIDGISPEIYNRYRRNGNFELVLSNLNKILYYKKQNDSKIIIEWQMIDFYWNKFEQKKAREYAQNIGCNEFRIIQEVQKVRSNYKNTSFVRKKNCILPYFTFNVSAYNTVRPCCKIYNEPMIIGDLNTCSLQDVWNGKEIQKIRNKKMIQYRVGCKTCPE